MGGVVMVSMAWVKGLVLVTSIWIVGAASLVALWRTGDPVVFALVLLPAGAIGALFGGFAIWRATLRDEGVGPAASNVRGPR
jgi:hypothetical protein